MKYRLQAVGSLDSYTQVFIPFHQESHSDSSHWLFTRRRFVRACLTPQGNKMLSEVDIYRTAHLMMHEYGNNAEREAAKWADRMLGHGDRSELLTWFRIWRTIAVMRQAPTGLPH
jgi:hypothetical protein